MELFGSEEIYTSYIIEVRGKFFEYPNEEDYFMEDFTEDSQLTDDIEGAYRFGRTYSGYKLPKYTYHEYWYWDSRKDDEEYKGEEPKTIEELVKHFKESYNTEDVRVIKVTKTIKTDMEYEVSVE